MERKWIFFSLHLLFWLLTSWLIISSFSIVQHIVDIDDGAITDNIQRSDELILFFSIGQPFFALYFYLQIYLTKKLVNDKKIVELVWKTALLIILYYALYLTVVYFFFIESIHILWFPSLWYGIFIFYIVISIAYGFIVAWSRNEKDKRQLEIANKQAELNLLRAQLHPHFLFNTMNNLLSMVNQVQNPKLAKSIDTLSNLLRYVVYENNESRVTIAKEIQFIRDFAELNLLRFEEDEVDFKLEVIGQNDQQSIEMSILLCFLENAFKHGIQPEAKSFIHIGIDVSKKQELLFVINNSVHPALEGSQFAGYGLQATKDRLQLAYPNGHTLSIQETKKSYSVTLKIDTDERNSC
ncbi:sensor histidine kinase [Flavivirga rizhaonensis]|uniref:Histidine kinase n=1 Tax=Flavivirga rizhaonensis TaxID=2559571 RepID=A0A4S1E2Z8_9FLAO|nr:sensor histidine kinase [Flavivirga rizhaonensis]TGV04733.1 histidine kinase [Flavivirga rizhaonensis]